MLKLIIFAYYLLIVASAQTLNKVDEFSSLFAASKNIITPNFDEDALLNATGLIRKYGYPVEVHQVQTQDGYLLTMHRIPRSNKITNLGPVFLMHGLLSSSVDFIINGPSKALGYILSDEGYDVWMGNARGNFYSRKHINIQPENRLFWKFSWNEIGKYDLPAMIDYVLNNTGSKQLQYIGHSQGTTVFFVMCSTRTEYNAKIKSMQALAPVAYCKNIRNPIVKAIAPMADAIEIALTAFGLNELLPKTNFSPQIAYTLCHQDSPFFPLCKNALYTFSGNSFNQTNLTMLPIYLSHSPAGSGSKQLAHFEQLHESGEFRQYDYGYVGNIVQYFRLDPPKYFLNMVTAPVALYYAGNDWLVGPVDVLKLRDELARPISLYKVPFENFTHMDFLWGINAKSLVYNAVIQSMKSFD